MPATAMKRRLFPAGIFQAQCVKFCTQVVRLSQKTAFQSRGPYSGDGFKQNLPCLVIQQQKRVLSSGLCFTRTVGGCCLQVPINGRRRSSCCRQNGQRSPEIKSSYEGLDGRPFLAKAAPSGPTPLIFASRRPAQTPTPLPEVCGTLPFACRGCGKLPAENLPDPVKNCRHCAHFHRRP